MDRRRLESAANEYHHLRGLLGVPLGLLFVLAALGNEQWGPLAHAWAFVAGVAILGAACWGIQRFYATHYGRVTLSSRQQTRTVIATLAVGPLLLGGATLLRSRADWSLDLPVNPIPAMFAVAMLAFYAVTIGVKAHHWAIFGALLAVGLAPFWNGADPSNIGLVMCGAAVIASGLLDHRLLARSLGPERTLRPGEIDAGA